MTGDDESITPPGEANPEPGESQPASEARTVFSPATGFSAAPLPVQGPAEQPSSPQHPSYPPTGGGSQTSFQASAVPLGSARPIQPGDVLNHIFEVRRFIARGGMGEVFEGINVNSDERVAIKVILPHLAADPSVQAMFRKEARTLTRLTHSALVQYRVLAQEPQLGVFYIVTEYIDGKNLSDLLSDIEASPAQLSHLTKMLAEGLTAAHALGAIHRDISPDNIMLEDGRLDRAKIIDFGIAKDLDASSGTIIGDGFAGKLNYVAPEQLGDFDRAVGPWTDVYSLGLTILALARRKDVDMGGTLVDAVDKRRAGPDLSPLPAEIRPVIEMMLKPNPAERLRSMEDVVRMLANPGSAPVQTAHAGAEKPPKPKREPGKGFALPPVLSGKKGLMIGSGVVAAALIGVMAMTLSGGGEQKPSAPASGTSGSTAVPIAADPVATARDTLAAGLGTVPCTWLDVAGVEAGNGGVSVSLRGVAGKTGEAQAMIEQMLKAKGVHASLIDLADVSPIDARDCGPLEAFRQIRAAGQSRLTVAQRKFEMIKLPDDAGADAGKNGAQAVIELNLGAMPDDFALVGIEETGEMTRFVSTRSEITDNPDIDKLPNSGYRLKLNTTHTGWSGILMLIGKGPFDESLLSGKTESRDAGWPARFLGVAQQRGWKAEMVWYRTVDEVPNQ